MAFKLRLYFIHFQSVSKESRQEARKHLNPPAYANGPKVAQPTF